MARFIHYPYTSGIEGAILTFDPTSATPDGFLLLDTNGAFLQVRGTGLTYDGEGPIGGLVTGITEYSALEEPQLQVTGLRVTIPDFALALQAVPADEGFAFFALLTRGRDVVRGGTGDDVLLGGRQADRIYGGRGEDYIIGGHGDDQLWGGGQSDVFVFNRHNDGADVIHDFIDRNGRGDDLIQITRGAYRNMVAEQTETGVRLVFSATSSVEIKGWSLDQIGADDFLLL